MVISVFGEVTRETQAMVRSQLASNKGEPVQLRIDSPGGDLLAGLSIYNDLKAYNPEVFIDGMAGSIASVIMFAGDTRHIVRTGTVAIHNAQQVIMMDQGDQNKFRDIADNLEKMSNIIVDVYEQNVMLNRDTITALMDKETLFNSAEAVSAGFATDIIEPQRLVAKIDIMDFKKFFTNNVQGPTEGAVLAEGTANNVEAPVKNAEEGEEKKEEEVEMTFSEAQMKVIAEMVRSGIEAAQPAQNRHIAESVAQILNSINSNGVPPTQARITETQKTAIDYFDKAIADIKNKNQKVYQ